MGTAGINMELLGENVEMHPKATLTVIVEN